ncbi:hypothetical protein CPB85DRAFT_1234272, partial [Mucidula mucida]
TVRYDDGTGDELCVPLGTTAFKSGRVMFDILPKELKSVVVRARAKYAPHPFEWMGPTKARSTALGIESEHGLEKSLDELSPWTEEEIKVYPFVHVENPVTGYLHLMVHAWAIQEVFIDPLPPNAKTNGMLYPDGAHLTKLKEVRELCYTMQRPGIAPNVSFLSSQKKDLMLWNNRGLMHTVVGHFAKDQIRLFHQCNLAASDAPLVPSEDDVRAVHEGIDEDWELL